MCSQTGANVCICLCLCVQKLLRSSTSSHLLSVHHLRQPQAVEHRRCSNTNALCNCVQSKGRARQSSTHTLSPPLSPKVPPGVDGESAGIEGGEGEGDAPDSTLNEQQQLAIQQEERVLTEQIESLQKEKYDARSLVTQNCDNRSAHLMSLCVCVCVSGSS